MIKIYSLIFSFLFLAACEPTNETQNEKTIEVAIENKATLKMSEYFELDEIIYFSDSLIIDNLKKVTLIDDLLVLHCSWGLDYLLLKNMLSGEEYVISNKGEGPEQYQALSDFFINTDNQIELLDGKTGKILSYNLQGELLSVYRNELLQKTQNFMSLNGEDYFLFGGNFYAGSYDHQLVLLNKGKGAIIEKFIPIDPDRARFMNFIEARNFTKSPAYFAHTYNPWLYKINENTIIDSVLFDFGSYNIPEEDLDKEYADVREFSISMQKSGNVYGFSNVIVNQEILFASAFQKGKPLHIYTKLGENQTMVFDKIENDLFGINQIENIKYGHRPLTISGKFAYFIVNIEEQNEIFTEYHLSASNQSDENKALLHRIENFKEGDNLAIAKLRILN